MPTKILPAYLFLGEEDFLKDQAVEKLKNSILNDQTKDLNYSVFYGKDKNFGSDELFNNLNTMPFLSKKRLVVIKDADSLPAAVKKGILSYLKTPRDYSVLVIEDPVSVIKGEFVLEASKSARLFYFRKLSDSDINAWLVKKAGGAGKKISRDAILAVKENLSNDIRVLSSNMDNIILYTGKRNSITKQDVDKVVGISISHTSFDLMDSIGDKDTGRALKIFSSLKRDKKRETELLGLLGWNARMLLRVKELLRIKNKTEMRRDLGLNPRMLDRVIRHAARFDKRGILTLLDEILISDTEIKTGVSPTLVIERLITKICR